MRFPEDERPLRQKKRANMRPEILNLKILAECVGQSKSKISLRSG